MIEIKGLSKVYEQAGSNIEAIKNIDLRVDDGEIFGIIGLSGAGKSTLVRCINALERPSSGSIEIDGTDISSLSGPALRDARKKIGMVFQNFNLLKSRTALGNVMFPLEITGMPKKAAKEEAKKMLELVGLGDKASAYPSQLSGGQKQRVGIARALANKPSVLLSDEATSALDPETTRSILNLLKDINRQLKVTIVLITHEMNVVKEVCDRVAVLEDGRIIESGPVTEVFTHPKADTTKKFVQSVVDDTVPEEFIRYLQDSDDANVRNLKVVRLTFLGEAASEPVISQLIKKFDVEVNIIHGNIDRFKDIPFGNLLVELSGDDNALSDALEWLGSKNLGVEVLS